MVRLLFSRYPNRSYDLYTWFLSGCAESITRGATILYATHIFDGLDHFPTHVSHMREGAFVTPPISWPLGVSNSSTLIPTMGSGLHAIALEWLKEDREVRRAAELAGKLLPKTRVSTLNYVIGSIMRATHVSNGNFGFG